MKVGARRARGARWVLALGGAAVIAAWAWRRFRWPCPVWFMWMLENSYVDAVAGPELLLDRAGVEPGMRILDVGSGAGRITLPAARRVGPEGEVVAVDVQRRMLSRLEKRVRDEVLRNVRFVLGDVGDLSESQLPPAWFDRAFVVTVLGEIADQPAALRAIHGALKPGGLLSVTEMLPDPHFRSSRTVQDLAERAGFRVLRKYGPPLAYTMNLIKESWA